MWYILNAIRKPEQMYGFRKRVLLETVGTSVSIAPRVPPTRGVRPLFRYILYQPVPLLSSNHSRCSIYSVLLTSSCAVFSASSAGYTVRVPASGHLPPVRGIAVWSSSRCVPSADAGVLNQSRCAGSMWRTCAVTGVRLPSHRHAGPPCAH